MDIVGSWERGIVGGEVGGKAGSWEENGASRSHCCIMKMFF